MRASLRGQPNSRSGFFRQSAWVVFNASAMLALAACGGGGGGGDDPPAPPVTDPPPPPPANTAPTVQAGDDQTITLPSTAQLSGSAQDAENNTLTYAWTSDPATVTFADAAAASTTATFPGEGTYTLTLSVSDGTAPNVTDTLTVTVQAATANAPPTVEAGENQTILLPATAAHLVGTATDDNANSTLTYTWSTTVPGASIASANTAETDVTLPAAAGSYAFLLTVSDGELNGTDTVTVTVDDPAVALLFPGVDPSEDDPLHGWAEATPDSMDMDVAFLDQARDYSLVGGPGGPDGQGGSGLIARKGRLVYSWGDIDDRYPMKSTTKSVAGIALGLALSENLVVLRNPAKPYLDSIGVPPNDPANPDLANITILQLATHTAGFVKAGTDPALQSAPGARWFYSDGGLNWLSDVLTQVYQQDLNLVLKPRVWDVLHITTDDLTWRLSPASRGPHPGGFQRREFASGMSMNTNAMARIGLLFLARGNWSGVQVFPETFVDLVKTPQPETAAATLDAADQVEFPNANTKYGVLWWTNASGELPEPVPADTYWGWGLGDSLIVVIPSLDLVIARAGNDPDVNPALPEWRSNWDGRYDVLIDFIKPIVCSTSPTHEGCVTP
ncbi:MAG: PKD domain-containing protein [Steroidobacter sp.]